MRDLTGSRATPISTVILSAAKDAGNKGSVRKLQVACSFLLHATPAAASCLSCLRDARLHPANLVATLGPNPHFHSMLFVRVLRLLTVLCAALVLPGVAAYAQVD